MPCSVLLSYWGRHAVIIACAPAMGKTEQAKLQGFHNVERFVKAPSTGPSPGPFLRLLRKLEGEKSGFWDMGGRVAATHTPNPKKREATL